MIDLDIGDLVVTSGKGGIFPSEIPIGILASKDIKNQYIEVDLFETVHNLSRVRIINYQLNKQID